MNNSHHLSSEGNNTRLILTASIVCALAFTGCWRKSTTEAQASSDDIPAQSASPIGESKVLKSIGLDSAVDSFVKMPTEENRASVKLAFKKLNDRIVEYRHRAAKTEGYDHAEATAKVIHLTTYRDAEALRFAKSRDAVVLTLNPPPDTRSAVQKAEDIVGLGQTAGPDAKTKTLETVAVSASIDTFKVTPNSTNRSSVKLTFARLDDEISELNDRADKTEGRDRAEASAKSINLKTFRDSEMLRFTKAQDADFLERNSKPQAAQPIAKTTTDETNSLGAAIDAFEDNPSEEKQSSARLAFAKLDEAIAKANERAIVSGGSARSDATTVANDLKQYRDAEMVRFTKAQGSLLLEMNRPVDRRSAAQKAEDAAAGVGASFANGSRAIGKAIGTAAKNTGRAIKNATH